MNPAPRRVLALLRERGWAGALLGVIALSILFVFLGRWQYHRHEAKVERRDRVLANYDAAPVPVHDLLAGPKAVLPVSAQWRPVRANGRYEPAGTVLVRNRPLDGVAGYEVLVPLRLASGERLFVDRGWIPAGETARAPTTVPAPGPGEVEVLVRLRPPEPATERRAPDGQAMRIDLAQVLGEQTGPDGPRTLRAYGVLAQEQPRPAQTPQLLPAPDLDLGVHMAYAIQWWGFALATYGILCVAAVREVRRRDDEGVTPVTGALARSEVAPNGGIRTTG